MKMPCRPSLRSSQSQRRVTNPERNSGDRDNIPAGLLVTMNSSRYQAPANWAGMAFPTRGVIRTALCRRQWMTVRRVHFESTRLATIDARSRSWSPRREDSIESNRCVLLEVLIILIVRHKAPFLPLWHGYAQTHQTCAPRRLASFLLTRGRRARRMELSRFRPARQKGLDFTIQHQAPAPQERGFLLDLCINSTTEQVPSPANFSLNYKSFNALLTGFLHPSLGYSLFVHVLFGLDSLTCHGEVSLAECVGL